MHLLDHFLSVAENISYIYPIETFIDAFLDAVGPPYNNIAPSYQSDSVYYFLLLQARLVVATIHHNTHLLWEIFVFH